MKKNYNLAGPERKALIKKIEEFTGEKSKYLGTPTYSYQVGDFNVSRYGELSCESEADEKAEKLVEWLRIAGFTPEGDEKMEEYREANQTANVEQTEETAVEKSAADMDAETAESEEAEIADEQEPATEETENPQVTEAEETPDSEDEQLESEEGEDEQPETGDAEDDQPEVEEGTDEQGTDDDNQLTISFPDDLTDEQFETLTKVIDSKATLLKHAFKTASVEIKRKDGKLDFPWFTASDGDHTNAYMIFLQKLEDFAKEAKRVTAQDHPVENEKYAFRTWFLRLGMIGPEYKGCRKILLENLTGSSAFRDGKKKEASAAESEEVSA